MDQLWLIPIIVVAFCVLFVGIWSLVCWLIAVIGGWHRLARYYRADHEPLGQWHSGLFAMLGIASYRGTLSLKVCAEGLYLQVNPLFKIAHPPLLIPWRDIEMDASGGNFTTLKLGSPHLCTLRAFISPQSLKPASFV